MSNFLHLDQLESKTLFPGFHARMVHTDGLTIAHFRIEKGCILPLHDHPHEQVSNIIEGTLEMTVGGETLACKPGTVVTIPGNTPHSARALTDCYVVDIFRPAREDYRGK